LNALPFFYNSPSPRFTNTWTGYRFAPASVCLLVCLSASANSAESRLPNFRLIKLSLLDIKFCRCCSRNAMNRERRLCFASSCPPPSFSSIRVSLCGNAFENLPSLYPPASSVSPESSSNSRKSAEQLGGWAFIGPPRLLAGQWRLGWRGRIKRRG